MRVMTTELADVDGVVLFGGGGIMLGGAKAINPEEKTENAVSLAKSVDQVVQYMRLDSDQELGRHDRYHIGRTGLSNKLFGAVVAVNPETGVVIRCGTQVSMLGHLTWLPFYRHGMVAMRRAMPFLAFLMEMLMP